MGRLCDVVYLLQFIYFSDKNMQYIPDHIEKKLLSTVYLLSVAVLEKFAGDLKLELVGDTVRFDLLPDTVTMIRKAPLSTEAEVQRLTALENELIEELKRARSRLQELQGALREVAPDGGANMLKRNDSTQPTIANNVQTAGTPRVSR
jgi:hypothetical protein